MAINDVCCAVDTGKVAHLLFFFCYTDEHRIMIFLPPSSHLLLKFQVSEESTTVLIAADNWKILPLVNSYLVLLAERN